MIYQQATAKKKGQSIGLFKTVYAISMAIGPIVGGFIYSHWSGDMVWYLSGIIAVFCLGLCWLLRHERY
ncbi:MFS transporter [Piscirickettsia litoralis]|uniref:Major facilitator superfamily (MFS) profile domain-containing protein n=1 Tax=Piscirickettsia litoralis TaxID=1891921 RepID=A0ABX3A424_9GAMM|nr:hypothetical protein BGC07_10080 [Piscirickettsia litoralis]